MYVFSGVRRILPGRCIQFFTLHLQFLTPPLNQNRESLSFRGCITDNKQRCIFSGINTPPAPLGIQPLTDKSKKYYRKSELSRDARKFSLTPLGCGYFTLTRHLDKPHFYTPLNVCIILFLKVH